jgi:LemA protein
MNTTNSGFSMSKKNITLISVCVVFVLLLLIGGSTYNGMVKSEEEVNNSWANVQSAYQRRLDLIPNLVNTVKGYAKHEKETLQGVTDARTGASSVEKAGEELLAAKDQVSAFNGPDSQAPTADQYKNLDRALSVYVNAVHEAYPDLKANENFLDLQKQLEGTENRINTERERYNKTVTDYNIKIRTFPRNILAGYFGFGQKQQFQADAAAATAPPVSFD